MAVDKPGRLPELDLTPVVLVSARLATSEEQPAGAVRFANMATCFGWVVRVTYALAVAVKPRTRQAEQFESVAVRLVHQGRRALAYGCWVGGRFSSAVIATEGVEIRAVNLTGLTAFVRGDE